MGLFHTHVDQVVNQNHMMVQKSFNVSSWRYGGSYSGSVTVVTYLCRTCGRHRQEQLLGHIQLTDQTEEK